MQQDRTKQTLLERIFTALKDQEIPIYPYDEEYKNTPGYDGEHEYQIIDVKQDACTLLQQIGGMRFKGTREYAHITRLTLEFKGDQVNDVRMDYLREPTLSNFLRLLHPIEKTQDSSCPHIEWMGEDLAHVPGVGEWKCTLQSYRYASDQYGPDSIDYRACDSNNHIACPYYQKHEENK